VRTRRTDARSGDGGGGSSGGGPRGVVVDERMVRWVPYKHANGMAIYYRQTPAEEGMPQVSAAATSCKSGCCRRCHPLITRAPHACSVGAC
jgi:hypothetical protein